MTEPVHGLAATIRSSTESETFDLGGLSASTIESLIGDTFNQSFPKMIRITLVVGAGKQGRQKYDAQALKIVSTTLQSLGFIEDRGASCIPECAGLFKLQHDTGKNLKTVVVFPNLQKETEQASANSLGFADEDSILPSGSLESKIAVATLSVFANMVPSKCPTWSQKKALLQLLDDTVLTKLQECDQLLMTGQILSPSQQSFYDSCRELTDKREYLQQQLQAHVDRGDLTKLELDHLKHLNDQRIEELRKEGQSTIKAQERHDKLQAITPVDPPKLKFHAELGKLWKQLASFQHLDETSNRLLSVHDTQSLGKKMELMEQINKLEQACRGWLEDDGDFQARLVASRRQFQAQFGIAGKKKDKSAASSTPTISSNTKVRVPVSKWVTPGETKQSSQAKKKARLKKGDVFGAMMATNEGIDTDEEESDEEGTQIDQEIVATQRTSEVPSNCSTGTPSGKKKQNKKKKGGGDNPTATVSVRDTASKATLLPPNEQQQQQQDANSSSWIVSIIQAIVVQYLLPFLLAIIQLIGGVLFGKPKEKKKKKQ